MNRFPILILVTLFINIGYAQKNSTSVNAEYFLFDKKGNKISPAFSFIGDFSKQGYAIFTQGGNSVENSYGKIPNAKYGIIHKSGKIIVPASFDYLEQDYNIDSLFIATLGEKYGLIDQNGHRITEIKFDELSTLYDVEQVLKCKEGNSYAFIDFTGKKLTKNYQEITTTTSGLLVTEKGYDGLLDKNYKEIFPCKYEDITEITEGIFHVTDKYLKHWLMDFDGVKLSESFDAIESNYDDNYETIGYTITKKGKEGYLNLNGKIIIPIRYNDLSQISLGNNTYIFSYLDDKGKYGLLDKTGKKLGKAIYSSVNTSPYFEKYILVGIEKKSKGKRKNKNQESYEDYDWGDYNYAESNYGLIDIQGKLVLKAEFDDYSWAYADNTLILLKKGTQWLAYDEDLNKAFDEDYSLIEQLGDLYKVQLGGIDNGYGGTEGGVYGLIDHYGKKILPTQYEDILQIGYDNTNGYIVKRAGKFGICSSNGKLLLEPEYTEITCEGDLCIVSKFIEQSEQTKMGLLNHKQLTEVIPVQYDFIESLSYEGNYLFKLNNKFGLIERNGTIVLPANYNYLKATDLYDKDEWVLANAYGQVNQSPYGSEITGGNWGVIDVSGDTILPFKYKEISFENDSVVNLLDYDGKAYLYNINQSKTLTPTEANYLSKINYDWKNPIYLMGKDVTIGEYEEVSGGTYGLVDSEGKELAPFNYSEIKMEGEYYIANSTDFNGYDLLDNKGKIIVKRATTIQPLNDSLFMIQSEGKASVLNVNSGMNFLEGEFTDFATPEYYYGYGTIIIGIKNKNDKWGILNRQGEMLIEPQYCDVLSSSESFVIAAKCGAEGDMFKYGVIDLMNNVLIPFEYESIEFTYGGTFDCVKGETTYSVNLSNEVLKKTPFKNE